MSEVYRPLAIVQAPHDAGAMVSSFDPQAMQQAKLMGLDVEFSGDPYTCVDGASTVEFVTERDFFRLWI